MESGLETKGRQKDWTKEMDEDWMFSKKFWLSYGIMKEIEKKWIRRGRWDEIMKFQEIKKKRVNPVGHFWHKIGVI